MKIITENFETLKKTACTVFDSTLTLDEMIELHHELSRGMDKGTHAFSKHVSHYDFYHESTDYIVTKVFRDMDDCEECLAVEFIQHDVYTDHEETVLYLFDWDCFKGWIL